VIFHLLELLIPPPSRYPDIFPVLNVLISTPVFVLVWLWSIKCGVEIGWALGGLPGTSNTVKPMPNNGQTVHHEQRGKRNYIDGFGRQIGSRTSSLGYSQGRRPGPNQPPSLSADVRWYWSHYRRRFLDFAIMYYGGDIMLTSGPVPTMWWTYIEQKSSTGVTSLVGRLWYLSVTDGLAKYKVFMLFKCKPKLWVQNTHKIRTPTLNINIHLGAVQMLSETLNLVTTKI